MKKNPIIWRAFWILGILFLVGVSIYKLNESKVPKDYFAVISNGIPDVCYYNIYLYVERDDNSLSGYKGKYIVTVQSTTIDGKTGKLKLLKKGKLDNPGNIIHIDAKYNDMITLSPEGSVTINNPIKELSSHKKGDEITFTELIELINFPV